ncbi:DUF4189 domain-containing protein [Bordetella muralis]|uniref:DUF4189 domain-containing protein n=1 Tax=Bordetella muralis TaxID=1649130 RepID=UPI0039F09A73
MVRLLIAIGLYLLSGLAFAEGGCPQGQTPKQYGGVWGCAPGGTDAPVQQQEAAPPQPTGYWVTKWGAIGGDAAKGILGVSTGMPNEKAAIQAALADCRSKGGGGCKLDISYYNQCAVLVTGNKLYNTSSAETIEAATAKSMATCRAADVNCRVYYSGCSMPEFVAY